MGTRADNRDGSCREVLAGRHAGKWRVQFTHLDELGRKKRSSRLFPNKTEAKTFLQSLRRGARIEAAQVRKETTLSGWIDWLVENDWSENLDDKTVSLRVGQFIKYVKPVFGGVPLSKINPLAVRAFYKELRDKGVGDATIRGIKSAMVRVFNLAISPYQQVPMTVANPFCLTLAMPKRREAVALAPQEAFKAIDADRLSDSDRAMLAVFLLAGLRLSEQMALTKGQICFEKNLIMVDRAVKLDKKGKQTVGLPKGDKVRAAVMCRKLKSILQPVCENKEDSDFIWASEANTPKMKNRIYKAWDRIVETCGLPPDMSPHDCRLTHINWIEKLLPEVSPTTLKEHVGHAAVGVTEVNYTRPITPAQDILRKGLDRLMKEPKKKKAARDEPPQDQ